MCGLIFHFDPDSTSSRPRVERALRSIQHRGPDAQHVSSDGPAHFAHARLSIVGLGDSHQPMASPNGSHIIVFNGEIYNFNELRQRLANRWQFRTSGDTEVLLAGIALEGESFLSRMEGMWAFACWDATRQELLLSRDRLGKKPLYYFSEEDRFSCASELPALKSLSCVPWEEDIDSTADYFRYGYALPGFTCWKNVHEVLPGHYLKWRPGREPQQSCYWKFTPQDGTSSNTDNDALLTALHDAVRKRLVADVEVGAFLSGGIDSSLICALAQSMMDRRLKTYTISFTEASFDESAYAKTVSDFLGTEHYVESFSQWPPEQLENLLKQSFGQPFGDSSVLPTALVSARASRDVKVALSGDGADELFGGYQRYQARLILRWYTRLPHMLRSFAEDAIRHLPEPNAHHSRSLIKKAHLFHQAIERHHAETPYIAPHMFHPNDFSALFPSLSNRGHKILGFPEQTQLDDIQRMMFYDTQVYLPQDIMTKVDRASMAYGLETRSPFLDHKVVELAFSRSAAHHVRFGQGKKWLRSAFRRYLPPSTWKRRKQGFSVPIHQWLRGDMGTRLHDLATTSSSPISIGPMNQMLALHRSGNRDHGNRLWLMYVYLIMKSK